jgi:hypothetical protein
MKKSRYTEEQIAFALRHGGRSRPRIPLPGWSFRQFAWSPLVKYCQSAG